MKIKRLLCLGMAMTLICSGLPGKMVFAQDTQMIETESERNVEARDSDYGYNELEDGTLEIIGYSGNDTKIVLPSEIDGKIVTAIGSYAFHGCSSLKEIVIPTGVTGIGAFVFSDCSNLTDITVEEGNRNYKSDNGALYSREDCSLLCCPRGKEGSFSVSKGTESISDSAFKGCSSLKEIVIPTGVTGIGAFVFSDCSNLINITVEEGNSVYKSENGALYSHDRKVLYCCPGGKKGLFSISEDTVVILQGAFRGCSSLREIEIPTGVTSIGSYAFSDCSSLRKVEMPTGVTNIDEAVFSGCSSLREIEIPIGVTSIESYAFGDCSSLREIAIPTGVISIGGYAFSGCSSLQEIEIPTGVTGVELHIFERCSGLRKIKLPSEIGYIRDAAFHGCSSLQEITIPSGVGYIESGVFAGCSSLTDIMVEEGNTHFKSEDGALYTRENCRLVCCPNGKRGSFSISEDAERISAEAFSGCSSLQEIEIPAGVTDIGGYAFSGCSSLQEIEIPAGVTDIGSNAFSGCSSLQEIEIPAGVTDIAYRTFSGCSSLQKIIIQTGVTNIHINAFEDCSSLQEITIPAGVVEISDYAFRGCSSLQEIVIPSTVMNIGYAVFSECSSLAGIMVEEGNTEYKSENGTLYDSDKCELLRCSAAIKGIFTISKSITYIDNSAFSGCASLAGIMVEEENAEYKSERGVLYRREYWASDYCELICCPSGKTGSFSIPEDTDTIAAFAFNGCNSLTNITIHAGVTKIWDVDTSVDFADLNSAFRGCSSLMSITVEEGNPVYKSENGALYFYDEHSEIWILLYCMAKNEGPFHILNDTRYIGEKAFLDCEHLTSISIPKSVTLIGRDAFPDNLEEIFYTGSKADWGRIGNSSFVNPEILRFGEGENDEKPSESGDNQKPSTGDTQSPDSDSNKPDVQKKAQLITAKDIIKTYGEKPFDLGVSVLGNAALSYLSSNNNIASVDQNGKVTITGCGVVQITVIASETDSYTGASKTVLLTVKPKKASLVSVKSKKKKTALVKWKKDTKAAGYIIQFSTDRKFKKNVKKVTVDKAKTTSQTVKKLKSGSKYYVRICAYAKNGKSRIQGEWSKSKTVKIKK